MCGRGYSGHLSLPLRYLANAKLTRFAPHAPHAPHAPQCTCTQVGELCEIFQWKGEVAPGLPGWTEAKRQHLGEEMADVLMYLVRLADKCDIDLPAAAAAKIQRNAAKYPADLVRGSAKKYNGYDAAEVAASQAAAEEAAKPAAGPPAQVPLPAQEASSGSSAHAAS